MMPGIDMEKGWTVNWDSLTIEEATRINDNWYSRNKDGCLSATPLPKGRSFTTRLEAKFALVNAIQADIKLKRQALIRIVTEEV